MKELLILGGDSEEPSKNLGFNLGKSQVKDMVINLVIPGNDAGNEPRNGSGILF